MRDDGVLFVCDLINEAPNGMMPADVLEPLRKYWFQIRTAGISRQYLAKGVNERVDLLVSVPFDHTIRIGQYAVLGNGEQFHIDTVAHIQEENGLRRTELGLQRLEDYYAVKDS